MELEQAAAVMAALTADESRFRLGENGHAELTADGQGDAMLALFDKLVRGLDEARGREFVGEVFAEARARGDPQCVKNLFVLAFQTRWCRGGKGERKICYQLLAVLYERYPEVVVELAELLPRYGYWKDLLSLLLECKRADIDYSPLRRKVFGLSARQLEADAGELEAAKSAHADRAVARGQVRSLRGRAAQPVPQGGQGDLPAALRRPAALNAPAA